MLMKFAIIIQARTGSTRFPKKILAKIENTTVLEFLFMKLIKNFSNKEIFVATTSNLNDEIICKLAKKYHIKFFRGSENNVLKRYVDCAKKFKIKNIVRITSDCPLIDPTLIKKMIQFFKKNNFDYYSNTCPENKSKFPDGTDIEIFKYSSLLKIYNLSKNNNEKEHVTTAFYKKNSKFITKLAYKKKNISNYKFSLDYKTDLIVIKKILKELRKKNLMGTADEIVKIISQDNYLRKISKINRGKYFKNKEIEL